MVEVLSYFRREEEGGKAIRPMVCMRYTTASNSLVLRSDAPRRWEICTETITYRRNELMEEEKVQELKGEGSTILQADKPLGNLLRYLVKIVYQVGR